jgi:ParB family chromosome partitioning protein
MSALGRGLASLIPRRYTDARKLLDEVDNMETLDVEEGEEAQEEPVATKKKKGPLARRVSVMEEEGEVAAPQEPTLPPKPLVTPLTIDPDMPDQQPDTEVPPATPSAEPETQPEPKSEAEPTPSEEDTTARDKTIANEEWNRHERNVHYVDVDEISLNPMQPRRQFDPASLEELKRSMSVHGLLQPLVVRRMGKRYELVSGERRLKAAKLLGWKRIPCVVRVDVSADSDRLELALIENIQRQNLNPVEEARAFKQLNEEYGMSHEEIGQKLGVSRVVITNTMRLLQLPDEILAGLAEGKITSGHARAILMIPDKEKQLRFYKHLLEEGLTVRKAELRARRLQRMMNVDTDPTRRKAVNRAPYAVKYNGLLEDAYGHPATVRFLETKNRYEVVFTAHNETDLKDVLRRLVTGDLKQKSDWTEEVQ